jgi:hypothetical protein
MIRSRLGGKDFLLLLLLDDDTDTAWPSTKSCDCFEIPSLLTVLLLLLALCSLSLLPRRGGVSKSSCGQEDDKDAVVVDEDDIQGEDSILWVVSVDRMSTTSSDLDRCLLYIPYV